MPLLHLFFGAALLGKFWDLSAESLQKLLILQVSEQSGWQSTIGAIKRVRDKRCGCIAVGCRWQHALSVVPAVVMAQACATPYSQPCCRVSRLAHKQTGQHLGTDLPQ